MDRNTTAGTRNRRWLLMMAFLLAVLVLPAGVAGALVSTPTAGDDQTYVDPDGRFQIPIPTNWTAEEQDGYVTITTADGKISVAAGIVEAEGATAGIGVFMPMIDAAFQSDALDQLLATPSAGGDESAVYTFDDGAESGQLVQALGRKRGPETAFVLVLRGDLEAVQLRQVQVDKILQGILIVSESGATPVASPAA